MSKKWIAIVGFAALLIVSLVAHDVMKVRTDAIMRSVGPGAEPSIVDSLQKGIASLGGVAGLVGIVFSFFHKWADTLPAGQTKKIVVSLVGSGMLAGLAQLRNGSKDPAFRKAMYDAAVIENQRIMGDNFPLLDIDNGTSSTSVLK